MKNEIIKSINNDNGFIGKNGFKIIELNNEYAKMEYLINSDGLNPMGIVHGGIIFSLADTTAGILGFMSGNKCVTSSCSINYLSPAKGKKIVAKATIQKIGNNMGYYNVTIEDENNVLIANAMVNLFFIK